MEATSKSPGAPVLSTGFVLFAGADSAELYDITAGTWALTDPPLDRVYAGVVQLADGRVLRAGGGSPATTDVEIFNPSNETWEPATSMSMVRSFPALALLDDDDVVVVGGSVASGTAERYDPAGDSWSVAGMAGDTIGHYYPSAVRLDDGRILFATHNTVSGVAHIYDAGLDSWSIAAPPTGSLDRTSARRC